mmetsp:Transcript_14818/g.32284  ORF Transcript_14818/g.32284 Transcript_14818/m.32284 type:complete len:105 (-) Transcript_14818:24-338(-)
MSSRDDNCNGVAGLIRDDFIRMGAIDVVEDDVQDRRPQASDDGLLRLSRRQAPTAIDSASLWDMVLSNNEAEHVVGEEPRQRERILILPMASEERMGVGMTGKC